MTNLLTAIAGPARADGRARSSFDDRAPRAGSVCTAVALQPLIQPSGPGNSSPVDVVLLLSLLMTAMWAATNGLRVRVPYAVPVALLVVAGAVAGLLGALPPVALLAVVQDIVLLGWCTALVNLGAVAGALRLITRTWALSSVCWAGVLVAAWLLHVTPVLGIAAAGGKPGDVHLRRPQLRRHVPGLLTVRRRRRPDTEPCRVSAHRVRPAAGSAAPQ